MKEENLKKSEKIIFVEHVIRLIIFFYQPGKGSDQEIIIIKK